MAVPAKYTATGIDTYTVLEMATGTVTKAASADKMISLDGTQYDGNLLEQISAFKQISVGKDYGYIQVNGYLFIMDGTGIVPAMTSMPWLPLWQIPLPPPTILTKPTFC